MTEDEAFIRVIVDNPGDETPRLVYADWLDDRDDPRGPYLRAEAEWAQPWKRGTPPGWSDRRPGRAVPEWDAEHWPGLAAMEERARQLDPLWVARVSRPPVGVCCDHLRFERSGPALTPGEIAAAAGGLGIRFPPALVAFYLRTNGGRSNWIQFVYPVGSDEEGWSYDRCPIEFFATIPPGGTVPDGQPPGHDTVWGMRDDLVYIQEELGGFGTDDVLTRYVPIARSMSDLLLVDCENLPGEACRIDLEDEAAVPERLVPSLPQLLGRLVVGGI